MLRKGHSYLGNQHFHAALELYEKLLHDPSNGSAEEVASLYDGMGQCYIRIGFKEKSLFAFQEAVKYSLPPEISGLYQMHLALAYSWVGEYDTAQRILAALARQQHQYSYLLKAKINNNLAFVLFHNEFYKQGLHYTEESFRYFSAADITIFDNSLYTNLGYFSLQLGRYDDAEYYLKRVIREPGEHRYKALFGLSTLYLYLEDYEESFMYAAKAIEGVWGGLANFEKEDIAQTCQLMSNICYCIGQRKLALRLMEKAKFLYGQVGAWNSWIEAQDIARQWEYETTVDSVYVPDASAMDTLRIFIAYIDAHLIQERLYPEFPALSDTRVLYLQKISEREQFNSSARESLVIASRLADYGLSAIDPEALKNPERSKAANEQYQKHPLLSSEMLSYDNFDPKIIRLVEEHHEAIDGSGFPNGKSKESLDSLTPFLVTSDIYARLVCKEGIVHSAAMQQLEALQGKIMGESTLESFESLFEDREKG